MNIPIGWAIAFTCALTGFLWLGGLLGQLWVPQEYLIIFGAAIGTLIAGNKFRNLKNLFKAISRIFIGRGQSKKDNLALLCLMFEILQKIKRDGLMSLEGDIEEPEASPLFEKYPLIMKDHHLVDFITDYLRMMLGGSLDVIQIESLM